MLDNESANASSSAEADEQPVSASAPVIDEDLPRPPSGRRSKTRPAGPPPPTPEVSEAAEPPAKKTTTRRSSSRTKAAAAPAEQVEATESAETAQPAERPEAAPEQPAANEQPKPATRTRSAATRTRRTRAPKTEEAGEQQPSPELEAAIEAVEATAPKRTRRATRSSAASLAGAEVPTDEAGEVDTQQVLASLAAAIANRGEAAGELPGRTAPRELEAATNQAVTSPAPADDDDDDDELIVGEQPGPIVTDTADSLDDEPTTPRRRRRRGGRRRRRSSTSAEESTDQDETSEDDDDQDQDDESTDESTSGTDEDTPTRTSTRRRRRRRRRSDDSGDDDGDVVVRVREPRRTVNDEISGIEGSTRLEAKKQRRREGRAAGRHRAPILTEAEFLARRESVERVMLVRQRDDYTQLAVLEDSVLVEHYVDRSTSISLIGNIYLGRVQNVLPSMEAVFIDIGRGRNAVLYAGEVDWNSFDVSADSRKVEQVFKSGQSVLVQVSKDPVGAKGARLTGHISIPGRYVVYSPGGHLSGISRKLPDAERQRLKTILDDVVADDASVIVRTAAEGASAEELTSDVERLKSQWQIIEKKSKQGSAPQQLYAEPDLTLRIIRDTFTEDFKQLIVAGHGGSGDAYDQIADYVNDVAQNLADRLVKWDSADGDPFAKFRIDEQISKALERKVFLPSGGSLVIDRTEAMTVIDVNTGKFTGSGGNLEQTVTRNNLEAAEEIVRQLRLRDLGGIIVIDFIDMVLPSNRELLLRRLVECLGRDRTRHQVSEVTSLGLVQMTRKRIGTGLAEAFTDVCEHCNGRGYLRHDDPVDSQAPADGGDRRGGRSSGSNGNPRGRQQRSTGRASRAKQDDSTPRANQVQPSEEAKQAAARLAAASRQHADQPDTPTEEVEVDAVPTEQAPEVDAV